MALRILAVALLAQASANLLAQQKPGQAKENAMCMDGHVAPSVFLMGYQKSGSTSLWNDLKDNYHLAVAKPLEGEDGFREKEVSYFSNDQRYAKGKNFYLKHFPTCQQHKQGLVMDASPNTVFGGEKTALRVKEFYGEKAKDLKFIIIARDPTARMESAYWHFNAGVDNNFDQYVQKTIKQAKLWESGNASAPEPNFYYPNMYVRHLKPWMELFNADQFAFITLKQYDQQHQGAMKHLSRRLKIYGKSSGGVYENHKREHPAMKTSTRKALDDFYAKSMSELEELIQEKQIGMGANPVKEAMSLMQTEERMEASLMDAETEEALRMEHGDFSPAATSQMQISSEVDEEIGGPLDFDETPVTISPTDIDFELNGDHAHP